MSIRGKLFLDFEAYWDRKLELGFGLGLSNNDFRRGWFLCSMSDICGGSYKSCDKIVIIYNITRI